MAARYTIRDHDTLHHIARRMLGHADQWIVLAQFNGLDYPYVDTSGTTYAGQKVLTTGDVLLVPSKIDEPRETLALEADNLYDVLLGRDVSLSSLGDLQANPSTGDLGTVAGIDNLVQALQRRIGTRKGELAYHPEYGANFEQHVGAVNDPVRLRMMRLEVIETLLADPRIRAIENVILNDVMDHVDVAVTATVIGIDDVAHLNLVIPKAG